MKLLRTARFDEECRVFRLRFCCEECGHFDAASERCRHGWPTAPHRRARYEQPTVDAPPAEREVVFCKEFELR